MTAAAELVRLLEDLERAETTVMDLACGGRTPEPWTIYPDEYGVFSRATRCQFYYHLHAGARREAGHFHTVRLHPDRTAHLVAISMAPSGWPQALFTVNLWAIGDAYETAENLKRYARRFRINERHGEPRLIRFVNLIFRAFRPEIERLQEEKAVALAAHRLAHPNVNPFEDRTLEVPSRVEIVRKPVLLSLTLVVALFTGLAWAEPLSVKAVMSPKEQIRADFPLAQPHFVLFVKREGKIQWEVQATFVPGPDGKPRLLDNGVWRFVGGAGALEGIKGAGTMHIKAVSPADREFELTGEAVAARK